MKTFAFWGAELGRKHLFATILHQVWKLLPFGIQNCAAKYGGQKLFKYNEKYIHKEKFSHENFIFPRHEMASIVQSAKTIPKTLGKNGRNKLRQRTLIIE